MLRERLLSGVLLGIPVLAMVAAGGWWMSILVMVVGSLALLEFSHMVARRGHRAFSGLMLVWMALFVLDRTYPSWGILQPAVALMLLATMGWALIRYRQGTTEAVGGFAMTVAGSFYVGWIAVHFISLRALDDGLFWTLTIVLSVWIADTAAYLIGRAVGRTPLIRDISPGKTWEGYVAGVITGTALTALLPLIWRALGAGPMVTPLHAGIIGFLVAAISPLGDLGISMIKRYAGVKNSSNLIPGHGGFLDRLDSILVAAVLGYYYLVYLVF
jgi:phosphatidate cytidylyltransferase